MKTLHRWFRSGPYSLLGHIDVPETPWQKLGAIIVPPFGWEDVSSYRPLRFLGKALAASGIPALRFDLPGTGDSSGNALNTGLFEAWIQSVDAAAAELRAAIGVEDVSAVGISLGALLALSAAGRGSNLQDLVLWGATPSGRAMLRELRAFGNMERIEYANGEKPPEQPIPGLEIAGFLLAPETQHALENFGLTTLPGMRARRVLVLTRDDLAPDTKLIGALRSSECTVEVETGSGYASMMALPHESEAPTATARLIVDFLQKETLPKREYLPRQDGLVTAVIDAEGDRISETIYTFQQPGHSLFGILSEPGPGVKPADWCILFLNAGAVRHTGPNRMWVEAARRWAKQGVRSLRLDLGGIGESDGEESIGTECLYQVRMVDQVEMAMESLRSRLGIQRFAAIGLCSGAFWAFHAAVRYPDICAAILLNPRLFFWDPEIDRRRLLRRTLNGLSNWGDWRRLAQGDVPFEKVKQAARVAFGKFQTPDTSRHLQIEPEAMAQAWAAIERHQSQVTLIFTEGEPLLLEMEEEGQMPPQSCSRVRCVRVGNGGHTFRPLWAQQLAHELIDNALREVQRDSCRTPLMGAENCERLSPRHDSR